MGELGDGYLRDVLGDESYHATSAGPTGEGGTVASPMEPTPQERRELAEGEIARASDQGVAAEAERYRSNQVDIGPGIGASASGMMFGQIGSGAGYQLDPDQLAAQIGDWEDILEEMRVVHQGIGSAARSIYSPTADGPATSQATSAKRSMTTGADDYQAQIKYLEGLITALRKAHGSYVAEDEETKQAVQTGSSRSGDDGTGSLFDKKGGQ